MYNALGAFGYTRLNVPFFIVGTAMPQLAKGKYGNDKSSAVQ
jgi:hypothetical protein